MKEYRKELKNLSKRPKIAGVTGFAHLLLFEKIRGRMDHGETYPTAYTRTMASNYRTYVSKITKEVMDNAVGDIGKDVAVAIETLRQKEFRTISEKEMIQPFSSIKRSRSLLIELKALNEVLSKIADVLKIHITQSREIMTTHILAYSKGLRSSVSDGEINEIINVSSYEETLLRIAEIQKMIDEAFERYGKE